MAAAVARLAERGAYFATVHGNDAMVEAACREKRELRILAVTVLTSLNKNDLKKVGVGGEIADQVVRLAVLAKEAAMDGVVAASHEVADIRKACGRRFIIVSPGIRPQKIKRNDQRRVMTPEEAIRAGVDYIVVGRPIIEAKDPLSAVREMISEMERGTAS